MQTSFTRIWLEGENKLAMFCTKLTLIAGVRLLGSIFANLTAISTLNEVIKEKLVTLVIS